MSTSSAFSSPATGAAAARATLNITVLAGGPGTEREVSLESGRMVSEALSRLKHRVSLRDIGPDDLSALDIPADVVFVALHGEFGEDGQVQRVLESRSLAYTGSGPDASALAMNKVRAKQRFIAEGIPTPQFSLVTADHVSETLQATAGPVVVKPVDSGSSVDTFIPRDRDALAGALELVVTRYGEALVEHFVDGPEFTVGVLDGRALPLCEIRTKRAFYDYQAKYVDDDTQYLFDTTLPADLVAEIASLSERAHRALGCRDFSRVDWMVDRETRRPFAIEVNTIPGFTSHSLLPKAAGRTGVSYDALCQTMVEMACRRAG